jgi:hypothetical protein
MTTRMTKRITLKIFCFNLKEKKPMTSPSPVSNEHILVSSKKDTNHTLFEKEPQYFLSIFKTFSVSRSGHVPNFPLYLFSGLAWGGGHLIHQIADEPVGY